MIYLYDTAIVDDLQSSFNTDINNPVVRVVSADQVIGIVAQIKEDQVSFPIVALERVTPIDVDENRYNFTRAMTGVDTVFDKDTNNFYKEKSIPINLSYTLTALTTNQEDMDELIRELIFKYTSMYFLKIRVPYESKREITFGVMIDKAAGINQTSGVSEYIASGQLYKTSLTLRCQGCVLLNYTPVHMTRNVYNVEAR